MLAAAQRQNSLFTFASTPPSIPIVVASEGRLSPTPLSKLKVLLCDYFVAVKKSEFLDKLSPRRVRAIHLGYDSNRRGHFVYILELQRITTVSDIDFDEKNFTILGTLRSDSASTASTQHRALNLGHACSSPDRLRAPVWHGDPRRDLQTSRAD